MNMVNLREQTINLVGFQHGTDSLSIWWAYTACPERGMYGFHQDSLLNIETSVFRDRFWPTLNFRDQSCMQRSRMVRSVLTGMR